MTPLPDKVLTSHPIPAKDNDNNIMVYLIKLNTEGVRSLVGVISNDQNTVLNFYYGCWYENDDDGDVRSPLKVNIDNAPLPSSPYRIDWSGGGSNAGVTIALLLVYDGDDLVRWMAVLLN